MNGRYASLFTSMTSRRSTSAKRAGQGSKNAELLFAMAIVACFWAARTSQGQIEVDAFVTNLGSNDVSVINLSSGTTNTIALSATAGGPVGVALTPDGRFAYITNGGTGPGTTGGTTVSVIDVATKTLLPTPIPVGLSPAGVAVTPDANFAYVSNKGGGGTVSVINTMTNSVVATIPLVPGLQGVAITPDGQHAYVADGFGQNTVSVIDTATNLALSPIPVGANPVGVAISPDGQTVYVTNSGNNTVTAINGSINTTIPINPPGPSLIMVGVAVTPDGRFVYVTSGTNNTVSVIDATTKTVSQTLIGIQPTGVSVTPDGRFALFASFGSDTVTEIETVGNTVVNTFTVGTTPLALGSFIGPNIIVAQGGPLSIANDLALTPLGFGTFVDFNGGTLQTTGNLVTARTISLLALGGIVDTNGFDSSLAGNIINSGSLTKIGAGTLTLSGNNTYTGGTAVNGGILAIGADVNLGAGSGTLSFDGGILETLASFTTARVTTLNAAGGTLHPDAGTSFTDNGLIAGVGGLTKMGAGMVILGSANAYTGGTTVLAGTLQAGTAGAFVNNTAYMVNGGTLDLNDFNLTMSSLNGVGGVVNLGSAALTVDNTATDVYSGVLQGTGSLIKIGAGMITLGGLNAYTGGTTVLAGTLQAGTAGAFVNNTVYTVNGGTLDLNNFNLTMSSLNGMGGSVNLGSAALTVDNTATDVYSGILQGTGSLTKSGAGMLTLGGANAYTGGTTVLAGTLQAGTAGAFVNNTAYTVNGGTLNLNNFNLTMSSLNGTGGVVNLGSAALTVDNTGANAYSGILQGTGSLTKVGAGTLSLSGNNTYAGGTAVNGGIIAIGADVNLGAPSGILSFNGGTLETLASFTTARTTTLNAAGGTLDADAGTSFTNIGPIVGGGGLTKIGAGTVTLGGMNTYTGGTNILGGVLSVTSDLNLGTGNIEIGNNAELLTIGASFASGKGLTLNSGGGTLASASGATAIYGGVISGTGPLVVGDKINQGIIVFNAANTYGGRTTINAGTLVVDSVQALGLGDLVVNRGVLRANSQAINVKGNYQQNVGGTLQLSLGGSAPGQYDVLNVGGRAILDGTLQLFAIDGFQPKNGDTLTLVLAAGGVSGQFATLLDPFGSFDIQLLYLPNSVLLEFLMSDFTRFALTPNQRAVARELDKVALDPRETRLISFLRSESLENLPGDFERISPDSLSALYEISFSAANVQASNLENRFADIRNGSTGFSSSLNLTNSPGALAEDSNGKAVIEPGKNVLTPSPENKWGIWISGSGQFADVNGDGNGKGYEFTTGGVSLGLDYRLTKSFAVGVVLGYAHTRTNLAGNGNIDVNTGRGGLYATFSQGGFYLNGYAGGAYNSFDGRRDALAGGASGNTDGGEFDGYAGTGYEFHLGRLTFGPIASLEYSYVDVNGYSENGSLAPLHIVSQNQDSLRTNVGLSAAYTWKAGRVQVRPSLRASWQHEYAYSALPIEAQFASGAGGTFTVNGPAEGHDSALIDAGVDVQWTPTIGSYFGYIGNVGRSNYDSNSVVCSVHLDF